MTLVGGTSTMVGAAIGALAIIAMQNYLTTFGQGAIFVVSVLSFRRA